MTSFVCGTCHRPVANPYDRIVKRLEYRGLLKSNRHAVVTVGHLCRTCADAEVERYRPSPQGTQASLL